MLSDIGDDDRVIKLLVDRVENIKRSHHAVRPHRQRMLVFPGIDLREPFRCRAWLYVLCHLRDRLFCIGYDRNIDVDVSGDRSGVDIDVDDLCVRGKFMQLSGDTVVETCSDGEQQIALTDCHIGRIRAVHAEVSDEQRVFRGDRAASHNSCDNRHLCFLDHFAEYLLRMCDVDTAAGKEQRAFCFCEHFQRTF